MFSAFNRINALSAFSLTTVSVMTFLCYASTAFNDYSRPVNIKVGQILLKNVPDFAVSHEKNDLGVMNFDLNVDLEPVFNWNVKQLFVYLVAEYKTDKNEINQVSLWDKIIKRGEKSSFNLKNEYLKYYFWDDGAGLLGNKNVSLSLAWNVIPNAGQLPLWTGKGSHKLSFPSKYATRL